MIRDRWWALISPVGVTIDSNHDRKYLDKYRTQHIEYYPCTVEELCIVKVSDLENLRTTEVGKLREELATAQADLLYWRKKARGKCK